MMEKTVFQQKITALLPGIICKFYEPMSKHTSFQIGGPAEVMLFPRSTDELADILKVSSLLDCKCAILGAGTNVLAPDAGLDGMVICLKDGLADMKRIDRTRILVGAGVTMARAAVYAAGLGLSGLEFAHGIPGTVGGGVYMNAGAYGGEIADVCESVDVMIGDGTVVTYRADEMDFSYRHSRVEEDGCIVLSAVLRLQEKPESEIRAQMQDLKQRRTASQPLDMPSAGSAFKRPVGGYAAALIDGAGLKGFRVGDAAVSEKHAGFVVNLGKAKASDVLTLLQEVSDRVYSGSGIRLEPEMRIW